MGDPKKGKQVSWDGVAAFLIVLRIAPFPPHWIANFVAPHLGIPMGLFWLTCFIGIAPVSVIHVTIGSSLDKMTSAADFHILSLRNILGLGAVVVAVLIPVGLKRIFKNDLGELGEAEAILEESRVTGMDPQQHQAAIDVSNVHTFGGLGQDGERGQGPIPVEVDEQGNARRYQAVDSGVILAGPSSGDPSLDIEARRAGPKGTGGRGKGNARVAIIADVINEEDTEYRDIHEVEDSRRTTPPSARQSRLKQGSKIKGYGTIDTSPVTREQAGEMGAGGGQYFTFGR